MELCDSEIYREFSCDWNETDKESEDKSDNDSEYVPDNSDSSSENTEGESACGEESAPNENSVSGTLNAGGSLKKTQEIILKNTGAVFIENQLLMFFLAVHECLTI
ncbi:hypothetical protein PR048_010942 [Dryococelus australis]|uniref:Uncharacterized protein n=1 Tax=Dryococelus australis TaxID=614101 RepID=A0ABQ9HK66_9NEOP|nr:hypothetical protein PR048_010942 [Dryococelus australis]